MEADPVEAAARVTTAAGAMLLVAALMRILKRVLSRSRLWAVLASLKGLCKHRDRRLQGALQRRLQQQTLARVRWLHTILAVCLLPFTLSALRGRGIVLPYSPTPVQKLFAAATQLLLGAMALVPELLGWGRTMDLSCGALVVLAAAELSPWATGGGDLLAPAIKAIAVWFAVCAARRTGGRPFCYLAGVVLASCFLGHGTDRGGGVFVIQQLLALMAAHLCELMAATGMASDLRSEDAQQLLKAASALLRGCCDVVVELDSSGAVVGRPEDLGSYLLRGAAVRGVPLPELLVYDEERERLRGRLFAPPQEGRGVAESMPVTLRDGNSSLLRVELLWFPFYRFEEELSFMAGFQECGGAATPQQPEVDNIVHHSASQPSASQHQTSSQNPTSSSSLSEWSFGSTVSDVDPPMAQLDCMQLDFPVRGISMGFCMRVGRLPLNISFLRWVAQPEAFGDWLREAISVASTGEEPAEHRVVLKMPQGRVEARCTLEPGSPDAPLDLRAICLHFRRVRLRSEHSERRRRPQHRGTPGRQPRVVVAM